MSQSNAPRPLIRNSEPYFYKYLTIDAARAVLRNGTLRWSAPSSFNDPFEFKFSQQPEFEFDKLKCDIREGLLRVFAEQLPVRHDTPPGCLINRVRAVEGFDQAKFIESYVSNLNEADLRKRSRSFPELAGQLGDAKVLCLTDDPTNALMWGHYSQGHQGVLLKFANRIAEDAVFAAAQPVIYSDVYPSLYSYTQFCDLLVGRFSIGADVILNELIFTKADVWSYEREWRIVLHGEDSNSPYRDINFDKNGLAAIVFGIRTSQNARQELSGLARNLNGATELLEIVESNISYRLSLGAVRGALI